MCATFALGALRSGAVDVAIWIQADIDKLKAAIIALATGESAQTVSYGGNGVPSRSVTYYQRNLSEMRSLLDWMIREVGAATASPTFRVFSGCKGV